MIPHADIGFLEGKTVLVTGATGSLGGRLIDRIAGEGRPRRLILFSRDETKQERMRERWPDPISGNLRYFIGDVRDLDRLRMAFHNVDFVVHTAALKQIATCEYNPFEAVQTNILGSQNVVRAALDMGVKKILALSTDKAVAPINLYGATKLVSEKLFVHANSSSGDVNFACVRYGNVIGSRGSVVEKYAGLSSQAPFPITDPRMTRFWISLEQAVDFVLNALSCMRGGEVFIPRIPSLRITDLANAFDPKRPTTRIPVRPGEKIHEVLVSTDEAIKTWEWNGMYVVLHQSSWLENVPPQGARPVGEGFSYTSDRNDEWCSPQEMRSVLKTEGFLSPSE